VGAYSLGSLVKNPRDRNDSPIGLIKQSNTHTHGVVVAQLVGPFWEEEEGNDITSDVVKVKGEDPATPGCLRENRAQWGGTSAILNRGEFSIGSLCQETPGP